MDLNNLIEKLVERIKALPDNTDTTLLRLMSEEELSNFPMEEIFGIYNQVKKKCESDGILLVTERGFTGIPSFTKMKIEDKEVDSLDKLIESKTQMDPFWQITLKQFFNKLVNLSEIEKIDFLKKLIADKEKFNEFTKEIMKNKNPEELLEKYKS